MTIAITCSCSAHLEVDEKFAGQSITCPDCENPIDVPQAADAAQRTSGYALFSLILALVGAFTILGTVVAVGLGFIGLRQIRNNPDRFMGAKFAWAGIILGAALTALSAFAFTSTELFGLDPLLRQTQWFGKLDFPTELKVDRASDGFTITRPNRQWGILKDQRFGGVRASDNQRDLLLVNPEKGGLIVCMAETLPIDTHFDSCKERGLRIFGELELTGAALRRGGPNGVELVPHKKGNRRWFDKKTQIRYLQMRVDKILRGQTRSYIVRIAKKDQDNVMYVVAGGADKARFADVEDEIREALDSFRIVERPIGPANQFPPPFGRRF